MTLQSAKYMQQVKVRTTEEAATPAIQTRNANPSASSFVCTQYLVQILREPPEQGRCDIGQVVLPSFSSLWHRLFRP